MHTLSINKKIKSTVQNHAKQKFYRNKLYYWNISTKDSTIAYAFLDNVKGKSLPITFLTIFIAELGDKTQIATVAMSAKSKRPLAVLLGSSTALVLACFIGAFAGGSITQVIPEIFIKGAAAIGFLYLGISLLKPTESSP